MTLTEEMIRKLPIISEDENNMFYEDGEFESVVLADFDKAADIIDAQYEQYKNQDAVYEEMDVNGSKVFVENGEVKTILNENIQRTGYMTIYDYI